LPADLQHGDRGGSVRVPRPRARRRRRAARVDARLMTTPSRAAGDPTRTEVEHRIVVPAHLPAVALLGPGDEVLRAVERGFPAVRVHARGDQIALQGPAADVNLVARLLDVLLEVAASGTVLDADVVSRSVRMLT